MRQSVRAGVVMLAWLGSMGLARFAATQDLQPTGTDLFQQALVKERADGRLEEAIAIYRQVLDATSDRSLMAQTLVRIGASYEKLGMTEAREAYERVARDYADIAEPAATARARLAAFDADAASARAQSASRPRQDREIPWVRHAGIPLRFSPDGRRAVVLLLGFAADTGGQNIGVYDLERQTTTPLTAHTWSGPPETPLGLNGVWSPDGRQVAYATMRSVEGQLLFEISVATPGEAPRLLFRSERTAVDVSDWLPDGSALVVELERADRSVSLGLVSLRDGTFTQLRTLKGWSDLRETSPRVSPDGRFIVFEDGTGDKRDLFLLATDGSALVTLDDHPARDDRPLWSPDSRYVVFRSNRGGQESLWGVRVQDGRPAGPPVVVTERAEGARVHYWTERGMAYSKSVEALDIYTAGLDPATGAITSAPKMIPYAKTGSNFQPSWSPDGGVLAFLRGEFEGYTPKRSLVLLPLDGSQPLELEPPEDALRGVSNLRWKPDGSELSLNSRDRQDRAILLRLSVPDTKWAIEPQPPDLAFDYQDWDPSWKVFYYGQRRGLAAADIATGEHELLWEAPTRPIRAIRTSPDGRRVAFTIGGRIWIFDRASGTARQIPDIGAEPFLSWSPDSQRLMYVGMDVPGTDTAEGRQGTDRVRILDISSGRSTDLDIGEDLTAAAAASVQGGRPRLTTAVWSPEGTRIAFGIQRQYSQMRLLENPLAGTDD